MSGNPFNLIDSAMSQFEEMDAVVNSAINFTSEIARSRIEYDPDATTEHLESIKKTMLGYLTFQKDVRSFQKAYGHVKEKTLSAQEIPENLDDILMSTYAECNAETSSPLESSPHFQNLLEIISEGLGGDIIPATQPLVTDTDEFIMIEHDTIPLDPISRQEVEDPVFNTICKHVYDRVNILRHIESRGGNVRCPSVGCSNKKFVSASLLQDHEKIKKLIQRKKHDLNKL